MKKIAIFASGSGSNAENIVTCLAKNPDITVDVILCNVPDAYVLERAKRLNIPSIVFNRQEFNDPDIILRQLQERGIGFIVLAGFLWLLPSCIINAYPNRIINIHPALLPKFGGKGMYGDHVHKAVIAAGEKSSGITIHYVNEHYDEGNIVFQAACPVEPEDTPESLAQKIHALEYRHFPTIVEQLVTLSGD